MNTHIVAVLAAISFSMLVGCRQTSTPQEQAPPKAVPIAKTPEEWRKAMSDLQKPKAECLQSSYPRVEWQVAPCIKAPDKPYPPNFGQPQTVGNGVNYAAQVTGLMSAAEGSFDSVVGVTSESGFANGIPPAIANTYSLQLNSRPFTTSACSASPNPGCRGWQQFIYSNVGAAFMQYWLRGYNTTCPAGWTAFPAGADTHCWRNSGAVAVPPQPIANLINLGVSGTANASGTDSVTMKTATANYVRTNAGNILNLGSGWQAVEFLIAGDCCGSEATFNPGSTITVRTVVHNGTTNAPSCVLESYTGETNNLTLVGTAAIPIAPSPSIVSTQSNIPGLPASCATAQGVGDTHLRTFAGLFYDFQASGDFVLAKTDADFVVQTRQISSAPTWPNASVNSAVATRTGKDKVAICLKPSRLEINDKTVTIADGKSVALQGGGEVRREGNVYTVIGANGDSMRAQLNSTWLDVSVGLGRWPAKVVGLLANANGNVNEIAARDGAVLTKPFPFDKLYGHYADSWRVSAKESLLLHACGEPSESKSPQSFFYAEHLKQELRTRARETCTRAGVKDDALLDACTLDVVVLKDKAAAEIFARMPAPVAVERPTKRPLPPIVDKKM